MIFWSYSKLNLFLWFIFMTEWQATLKCAQCQIIRFKKKTKLNCIGHSGMNNMTNIIHLKKKLKSMSALGLGLFLLWNQNSYICDFWSIKIKVLPTLYRKLLICAGPDPFIVVWILLFNLFIIVNDFIYKYFVYFSYFIIIHHYQLRLWNI